MFKLYKLLFLNSLMIGTLISVSSYSWLSMWMGLEINLLSIIPLLSSPANVYPAESALKYFITQALASSILLFSVIMIMNFNEFMPQNSNMFFNMMTNSALLLKLGAAPFHFWFPEVMDGLNWMNCLIMLTWQKIAPMVLLMYNLNTILFLSLIIVLSTLIGSISGLNQTSLRKIMAYSSINHISWMVASMLSSKSIWLTYFCVYSIISVNIVMIFNLMNLFQLKQLFLGMSSQKTVKWFFIMNFLSLGGLPPFLGFLPKWLVINNLLLNKFFIVSFLLIVITLITLFFYLRITFSSLIFNSSESGMLMKEKHKFLFWFLNALAIGGLMISSLIFFVL